MLKTMDGAKVKEIMTGEIPLKCLCYIDGPTLFATWLLS
jgi:hypothetical protein